MPPDSAGTKLIDILKKIPIFAGLSPNYVRLLLNLCENRRVEAGTQLFRSGTASDEMYILLSGELDISTKEGTQLATIKPVAAVGVGVITGETRMATAEASQDSQILAITKITLDRLLRDDKTFASRVYRNFINIVSENLSNDNIRLSESQFQKSRFENRIDLLERRIEVQKRTLDLVLDYLETEKIMPRAEAQARLDGEWDDDDLCILIVDDEADFRQLLVDALPDYLILEASNGREALEVLSQETPDLVITDIRMPEMDGIELLEELKERYPSLPVLAISGFMDPDEVHQYGFDGFIRKPVKIAALIKLVEAALYE
jgi:CheY-like chemotaxis protein